MPIPPTHQSAETLATRAMSAPNGVRLTFRGPNAKAECRAMQTIFASFRAKRSRQVKRLSPHLPGEFDCLHSWREAHPDGSWSLNIQREASIPFDLTDRLTGESLNQPPPSTPDAAFVEVFNLIANAPPNSPMPLSPTQLQWARANAPQLLDSTQNPYWKWALPPQNDLADLDPSADPFEG